MVTKHNQLTKHSQLTKQHKHVSKNTEGRNTESRNAPQVLNSVCCICLEPTKYKTSCNHYICIACSEQNAKPDCPLCRQMRKDICYLCYELTLSCPCYIKYLFEPDDKAGTS